MEYPYADQAAHKKTLKEGNYVMFATDEQAVDSGIIMERKGNSILVAHENNDGGQEPVWYELDKITLYRDSDWPDTAQ